MNTNDLDLPYLIPLKSGQIISAPYLPGIERAIKMGWAEATVPGLANLNFARTRSNVAYDCITKYLRREFEETEGIEIIPEPSGWTRIYIPHELGIINGRVKKLDIMGRPNYIRTQSQKDYYWQQKSQLTLAGMPSITNVVIGYQTDIFGSKVTQIIMQCFFGNTVVWSFPIGSADGESIETRFINQPEPPRRPRFKKKESQSS